MYSSSIHIKSRVKNYSIHFGCIDDNKAKLQDKISNKQVMIITDENVAGRYLTTFQKLLGNLQVDVYILPPGETSKKLSLLEDATRHLLEKKHTKTTTIIALGGGMVGDFAGLLSALYFRGVDYIQVPTTLLSMVDSSVGGKTAVNHSLGKNILGVIYPPNSVFMDINFLLTLPMKEFISGLSEVIKYGVLFDDEFFNWLEQNVELILQRDPIVLISLIRKCCSFKADVVDRDECEMGDRMLLNLGHTLAHALERVTDYTVFLHGEAVAIGLVFASNVSNLLGRVSSFEIGRIQRLLEKFGLPVRIDSTLSKEEVINAMLMDKKNYHGGLRMVLLDNIGHGDLHSDVPLSTIEKALSVVCRS